MDAPPDLTPELLLIARAAAKDIFAGLAKNKSYLYTGRLYDLHRLFDAVEARLAADAESAEG